MKILLAVLGLITAFAVVPIDTRPLGSISHPAIDHATAVARFATVTQAERDFTMDDARSALLDHGMRTSRVVVLVHGLTNSPRQFRELGQLLFDRGYNVLIPRLPRHGLRGGDVGALKTLTAEQYRDYADRAVDDARGLGDSIVVIGLSAGADVAIWIAQHRPDVTRVVVIAPAISLARVPGPLDVPVMNLMTRVPNMTFHQTPDTLRPHAYFGVATRAVGQTLRFGASVLGDVERRGPAVHDLAVVVNANDHTIDAGPVARIAEVWSGRDGTRIALYRFPAELRLPHDVIDATQRCGMPDVVYPVVIALVEARAPEPTPTLSPRCPPPTRLP
jgi:carboxylesterase